MCYIELHRAPLGLTAPWTVATVDLDMSGQRMSNRARCALVRWNCGGRTTACACRFPCAIPPGTKTNKWNKIEPVVLLYQPQLAWGALVSHAVIVNSIAATVRCYYRCCAPCKNAEILDPLEERRP
jgi:hypothetical protein